MAPDAVQCVLHVLVQSRGRRPFRGPAPELLAKQAEGFAGRLLADDPHGWFPAGQREPRCAARLRSRRSTIFPSRFGPDMSEWHWGRLHRLPLKHVLSNRGDLGQLLDHGARRPAAT